MLRQQREAGCAIDLPPDHHDGAPTRHQDTLDLAQRAFSIGEVVKPELAADNVKARVCERQRLRIALDDRSAFDRRQLGRDCQHGRNQVQSRDVTIYTDRCCRQPCDEPCAARDVENTQSWSQRGKPDDARAPRSENGRHNSRW
jgi:hypothetical protein